MSTTATYFINSPAQSTEFIAPGGYWFRPDGTSWTVTVKAWSGSNGGGSLVTCTTLVAYNRNISTSANLNNFVGNNANTTNVNTTGGNGSICAGAVSYTGAGVGSLGVTVTYNGTAYVPTIQAGFTPNGSPGSVVTVNGSDFHDYSVLTFAGINIFGTATQISDGQLTFPIPVMNATAASFTIGNANGQNAGGPVQVQTLLAYNGSSLQYVSGLFGENASLQTAQLYAYDGSNLQRVY